MCCIFKYFSFTVDLIQRIWTFLMSCCIAGAICCLFFVVSMAGIALGYNYSISEFITLRNSQVSVFMKRDVTEDTSRGINWRHSKSEDQRRPFSNQEQVGPIEYRYVDSLTSNKQTYTVALEADGENKYERLLLPLITKSLDIATATMNSVSKELGLEEIIAKYPSGSVDQMKAILNYIYLMKLKKHWRSSTKVIAIKNYLQSKENKTITDGQNVTFLADYDETELKNWRRVVQNNNIYSIAERPTLASSSQDVDKLPGDWVDHKSSVQEADIKNQKSETDFKTTFRSRPNRRKIYTVTRTIPTYIVSKTASNFNITKKGNVTSYK